MVSISADSDVDGSFVLEYMGYRSDQVRVQCLLLFIAHIRRSGRGRFAAAAKCRSRGVCRGQENDVFLVTYSNDESRLILYIQAC